MATFTNRMEYCREQADGRCRAKSVHLCIEDGREFPFLWLATSEADAIATMNSAARTSRVEELAKQQEEADFYNYVQINDTTAGFSLYHHKPEERDTILLSKYFTAMDTGDANKISAWVLTLTASYIEFTLGFSPEATTNILNRANHLKNTIEPEVKQDQDWQDAADQAVTQKFFGGKS